MKASNMLIMMGMAAILGAGGCATTSGPVDDKALADERLTTVGAQRSLRQAGVRAKNQRAVIDQAAAVGILQGWLDQRRALTASAPPPGADNA